MSASKEASEANQDTELERQMSLVQKKIEYRQIVVNCQDKQKALKLLRLKALNTNPDELSKIDNEGLHHDIEMAEDSVEELLFMKWHDVKYMIWKQEQEKKNMEKVQESLNLMSVEDQKENQAMQSVEKVETSENVQEGAMKMPGFDVNAVVKAAGNNKSFYQKLVRRINREQKKQQKFEMKKHIERNKSVIPPK